MESIINYFQSLDINFKLFFTAVGALIVALLALAVVGRFIFGKRSTLCRAVSSAIGILFIYAITIVLGGAGEEFQKFLAPLPFVTYAGDTMVLFSFQADYTVICSQVLSMIILAFLVNLVNRWMPQGKKLFSWLFFRILSVALGMVAFAGANYLLTMFLPEGLLTWAPVILLGLLVVMLLVGALKGLMGAVLATVNPLIGFLYTFFFANVVGKMLTRAMLTTVLLTALVCGLNYLGVAGLAIGTAVLVAYIPLLLLLLVLWFIVGKLL